MSPRPSLGSLVIAQRFLRRSIAFISWSCQQSSRPFGTGFWCISLELVCIRIELREHPGHHTLPWPPYTLRLLQGLISTGTASQDGITQECSNWARESMEMKGDQRGPCGLVYACVENSKVSVSLAAAGMKLR